MAIRERLYRNKDETIRYNAAIDRLSKNAGLTRTDAEKMIEQGYEKFKGYNKAEEVLIYGRDGHCTSTADSKRAILTLRENFNEKNEDRSNLVGLLHTIADAYRALDAGAKPAKQKK